MTEVSPGTSGKNASTVTIAKIAAYAHGDPPTNSSSESNTVGGSVAYHSERRDQPRGW